MKTTEEKIVFRPVNSQTGQDVNLAMQELTVTGRVLPVGASLQVRHVFQCAEQTPVEVVYAFVLPRDAALRRFRIVGKGFSVMSELKPTAEAVRIYEQGIEAGSLSSLTRQYRDGVVNLNVGNIRPGETVAVYLEILAGVEVRDDGLRFRFPFTLAPAYHAQAKTIEVEPGAGEMELPEEFGDVILPRWMKDATGLHRVGFELTVALPQAVAEIGSPSHAITVRRETDGQHRVSLAPEKDVPDRDLVLDIRTQAEMAGVTGGIGKDDAGHLAVVVPSSAFGEVEAAPRRIVFVIDRSGSMSGAPIAQARRAVEACLGALSEEDAFGVVAFDSTVECLAETLMDGSRESREAARKFLASVDARGGTELAAGFRAAAKMLGKDGGDVLVLTDGGVMGTETILAKARAAGIRIHCLGIGSASQDRFLTLLARETGGVSRFLTARERVDMAAVELFANIGRPVARGIRVEADGIVFAPEPPPAIFAGTPLVLFGETAGKTDGKVRLTWDGGKLEVPIKLVKSNEAETVALLQGARLITDMEARMESVEDTDPETARQSKALETLSAKYGLASRAMALVAVVKREGDKPGDVPKTMVVPVGMPQDTEFRAYFANGISFSSLVYPTLAGGQPKPVSLLKFTAPIPRGVFKPTWTTLSEPKGGLCNQVSSWDGEPPWTTPREYFGSQFSSERDDLAEGLLVQLAGRIEPDGGMPGKDDEERWVATATALLCFLAEGHTAKSGAFRTHVKRLLAFLKSAPSTATDEQKRQLLELVEAGTSLSGDWLDRARLLVEKGQVDTVAFWKEAGRAMRLVHATKEREQIADDASHEANKTKK